MRYALAENAWELLLAAILLVVVLGIAFSIFTKYRCRSRLASAMQVAEAIKLTLLEIQQTKQPYFSQTLDADQLNSSRCSLSVSCDGYRAKITVDCGYCGNDTLIVEPYSIPCDDVTIIPGVSYITVIYTGNRIIFQLR